MERYRRCNIKLNREFILKNIRYNYRSVAFYCRVVGISRSRFYEILSKPHFSENEKCLQDLSKNLGLSIYDMLEQ